MAFYTFFFGDLNKILTEVVHLKIACSFFYQLGKKGFSRKHIVRLNTEKYQRTGVMENSLYIKI